MQRVWVSTRGHDRRWRMCAVEAHRFPPSFLGFLWAVAFPVFLERFRHSLGNGVMKAKSYIPALCFQRGKCDCQVYKRLFMFSGVKWGASARSRARGSLPCPG